MREEEEEGEGEREREIEIEIEHREIETITSGLLTFCNHTPSTSTLSYSLLRAGAAQLSGRSRRALR